MHVHTSSQCDQIGGNFATLAKSLKLMAIFLEGWFRTWQNFEQIWADCYDALWQMFIVENGKIFDPSGHTESSPNQRSVLRAFL